MLRRGPIPTNIRPTEMRPNKTVLNTAISDILSPSTQILIKNTFIQFEDPAAQPLEPNATRPRGDSCDAVLLSSNTPPRVRAADALLCIPENSVHLRETDEETTDHESRDSLSGGSKPSPDVPDSDGKVGKAPSSSRRSEVTPKHQSMSPAELLESLAACEQLKRMALDDLPASEHEKTTIMLRNIPNKYTQSMLLEAVDQEFRGLYDFFYLPIDFKNKCNVGYAFINFIHPYYADLFSKKFAGLKLTAFKSKKVCEVSWGRVQGLRANIDHYRNSAIMSIPNSQYKPLIFKDGIPLQFPGPAGPVHSVKPRHGRAAT